MSGSANYLTPGVFVRHPGKPEWGTGQVQSCIEDRVTIMFQHAGKVVIDGKEIVLDITPSPNN